MSNDTTGVPDTSLPIVIPPTGPKAPVPAADGPSPIEGRLGAGGRDDDGK